MAHSGSPGSGGVGVFILDLDRSAETLRAVNSALQSTTEDLDVLVLMNGSSREHVDRLRQALSDQPRVRLFRTDRNLGFAGGNNYLLKEFREAGFAHPYILFLNNDAYLEPDTVSKLRSVLESRPDAGVAGPRILLHGSDGIIASDGAYVWTGLMQQSFLNTGKLSRDVPEHSPTEVPFVSGTCMMVRVEPFVRCDGFDESLFAYFEDWDLCLRSRRHGLCCLHVGNAVAWHVGALTFGEDSLIYHFLMTRNRYLMASRHLPKLMFACSFLPYFLVSRIIGKTIQLLCRGQTQGIRGIYLALGWIVSPMERKASWWPGSIKSRPA